MSSCIDPKKLTFILCFLLLISGFDGRSAGPDRKVSAAAERIHVHTDREVFVAGESLLFKAYLLRGGQDLPSSEIAYMALRNQHGTVLNMAMPMQGMVTDGNIFLEDTLSTGWYELVAFTNQMRATGEAQYFRKTLFIANRFDQELIVPDPAGQAPAVPGTANADQQKADGTQQAGSNPLQLEMPERCGTREAVRLRISLEDGPATFAMLSVSISPAQACHETGQDPAPYAEGLAGGPSSGATGRIGSGLNPSAFVETNNYVIQGRVNDPQTGTGVEGVRVVLNTPGTGVTYLHAQSDAEGRFQISLPFYYNGRDLYLSAVNDSGDTSLDIEVDDKFSFANGFHPAMIPQMEARRAYISRSQDLLSARKAFHVDHFRRIGRSVLTASPPSFLFAQPRLTIIPAQYTPFEDLQEVAREIVPPWRIRVNEDTYRSQLHCADTGSPLPDSPLYFVDGILVHDLGRLIPLGSRHINRILVHNTQWVYNGLTFHGAVNIVTNGDEYLRLLPPGEYLKTRFDLYLKDKAFHPPAYPNGNSVNREEPDLRNTLYWNPEVRISRGGGTDLRFYTGDVPGEYLVRVDGVSSSGERISLSQKFIVEL
jgi:hypothetical protein